MKKKILIVDDESSARFLLELMLRKDFKVDTAADSRSAIDLLNKDKFDLVLMDINLGKSDSGITALKKIRQIEDYQITPVIAVTAYAMAKDRQNLLSVGFNDYISKPFEKEELLLLVETVLEKERVQNS